MSGYGNYMEESNLEWYVEKAKELTEHINKINAELQKAMDNDPNLWTGKLCNDPKHWAEYNIHTVAELENYLDAEASRC